MKGAVFYYRMNFLPSMTRKKDIKNHPVKNAFLYLKQWRGIATRYAKNTASFFAAVQMFNIMV
jgi:transposase